MQLETRGLQAPAPGGGPRSAAARRQPRLNAPVKWASGRVRVPPHVAPAPEAAGPAPARIWRADDKPTRRRVVIDSQASRTRQDRVRRWPRGVAAVEAEKPAAKKKVVPGTESPVTLASGATVKDMADALELSSSEIIKTMMKLGEMVTITQSLSDEAIEILAEEFERQVTIQHAEEESDEPDVRRRPRRSDHQGTGGDHHGARRPRQDVAARRHA